MSELTELKPGEFADFLQAVRGNRPFPWQQMLVDHVADGDWPDVIDLPTASGKTAAIDVAVFALALQAGRPTAERTVGRRIWFVVDRRIVVDDAYDRARKLADALLKPTDDVVDRVAQRLRHVSGTKLPLAVARLRGGVPRSIAWAYHPAQPAVITSTVDQYGSRLLFRGYGVGKGSRPIHAALAGTDSLVLLDEAHLARPLVQTANLCQRLEAACATSALGLPFHLTRLSATVSPEGQRLPLTKFPVSDEQRRQALDHPLLRERFGAAKNATLVKVDKATATTDPLVVCCTQLAAAHVSAGRQRIAVMVNRVATATAIYAGLAARAADAFHVVLLTGRMRPVDRDALVRLWAPKLKSGSEVLLDRPIVLVTTQCLEVGADFSFDALVTECASLDAIRQRFGRLDRLGQVGNAGAEIVIRANDCPPVEKLDDDDPLDPVYGNAAARTWAWLNEHATPMTTAAAGEAGPKSKGKKATGGLAQVIDLGVNATEAHLAATPEAVFRSLLAPTADAPILLPAYLDLLAQTGPAAAIEPDVSLFLHGPDNNRPEASVVWRADLVPEASDERWIDTVRLMPPVGGEKLAVPLFRLRRWVANPAAFAAPDTSSDVESERAPINEANPPPAEKPIRFLRYCGRSAMEVFTDPDRIGPGDVIVVPAAHGFPRELGACPGGIDVYERAYPVAHGRPVLRLSAAFAPKPEYAGARAEAVKPAGDRDADVLDDLLKKAGFHRDGKRKPVEYPSADGTGGLIVYGPPDATAEEELDPFDFDDERLAADGTGRTLEGHTTDVHKLAVAFAEKVVGGPLAGVVQAAADRHDWGKADPRFQRWLNGGRRFGAGKLLAKSSGPIPRPSVFLPQRFRHEMLSVQLIEASLADHPNRDLILHLIAAHHGHARPFAPVVIDPDGADLAFTFGGATYAITADERTRCPPHHLGSGVPERFWDLTRQYGWWGLAALEALLRLADHQASRAADDAEDQ